MLIRPLALVPLMVWFLASGVSAQSRTERVILIVADDLRADVLGCYGDPLTRTPNIDELARRGVLYDAAYCQATWCAPSRTSFMRSRYLDKRGATLGEVLRGHGIPTARVSKIFHMAVPRDIIGGTDGKDIAECWTERWNVQSPEAHSPGEYACLNLNVITDSQDGRQSSGMPHRAYVSVRLDDDGEGQADSQAAGKAIEWIEDHKDQRYFLAVGMVRPHYPMVAPDELFEHYPHHDMPLPPAVAGDLDDIPAAGRAGATSKGNGLDRYPENQQRMWSAYRASVEFADRQIGRILDHLRSTDQEENTMIVFTSDHGYHLGEHTFWQKSRLHENVARVPLIIQSPGCRPHRHRSLTELVDLMPTICKAMECPVPSTVQGRDLAPTFDDPEAGLRQSVLMSSVRGNKKYHLLRTERWAYIRYDENASELYDMTTDPEQHHNLANRPDHQSHRQMLDQQLATKLREVTEAAVR